MTSRIATAALAATCLLAPPALAADQPSKAPAEPLRLRAIRLDEPPKIDGLLNDPQWLAVARDKGAVLAGWLGLGAKGLPTQQRVGYVAWDANCLYVAMQAFAPDIFKLKAGRLGTPFVGDCLEIHIVRDDGTWFQFGIDCEGNLGTGKVPEGVNASKIVAASEFGMNFWATELAIPWSLLGIQGRPGSTVAFNLAANMAMQDENHWQAMSWAPGFKPSPKTGPILTLGGAAGTAAAARPDPRERRARTREAVAVIVEKAPELDGALDDAAWKQAAKAPGAVLRNWVTVGPRNNPLRPPRTAWLACDDKHLYVALRAAVKDVELLTAYENPARPGDTLRVDFAGAAVGADIDGRNIQIVLPYILPIRQAARIGDGEWTCELAIPWSDAGGRPAPGKTVPINLAGTDSSFGKVSWAPVKDFRDTKAFGTLTVARPAKTAGSE